ncbi:MAG TPA: DUF1573 domain-containing protein [Chitinophagaceae bacterium]|nr:DUF1573 domain-containing protein [Chitinophagaceae bacterium]
MKKITLLAAGFVFALAAVAQTAPTVDDMVKFNTEKHDFGKIRQGTPVTYNFEFKNTSNKPVVVESANASCGCTVPEKPEKPIEPGGVGVIKVQYNAAAVAPFTKDVYIKLAGIDQPKILHVTGEVLTPEAFEAWEKEKAKSQSKTNPVKN